MNGLTVPAPEARREQGPHRGRLIRSFHDLGTLDPHRPVVTLFSGGLDSTYLLHRLRQSGFAEVHALGVGLGGEEGDDGARATAETLGAITHTVDARETFATEFVAPAIAAQAVYLDAHPVSSTLSRPLIARIALRLAGELNARAVLHTANRSQNSLRRLNGAMGLLGWSGHYGSPYDLCPVDRERKIAELAAAGVGHLSGRTVSGDANLWCREFESGVLDDPEDHAVPEHLYRWSVPGGRRPPGSDEIIEIGFESGVPVVLDGRRLPLHDLIGELNTRVGAHGLGRYSGLEHLEGGQKVLEVREMPAAWLLLRTSRHLEHATLTAETVREKLHIEQIWVREALEGRWYGELRSAAQAFIDACTPHVTGSVRWRLTDGRAHTVGIVAHRPRYLRDREAWEREGVRAETETYRDLACASRRTFPGVPPRALREGRLMT
ncbi:argininosuccinate synthase-related protein [Streptomyces sp. NPDC004596]|uniref:argininosuccinate synthase-related protein n=1 Tax=Streptomyces sp. DSM 118148 TaxID=3448667 RepID=UPI00403FD6F5